MSTGSKATHATGESRTQVLETPRVAGAMGIVCAVLLGTAMVLIRITVPAEPANTDWVTDPSHRQTVVVVLGLVPFAGIFFLWVMGAVRNLVGTGEDKFFATLFLGSGLLFVATLFVLASVAGAQLAASAAPLAGGFPFWQWGRELILLLLSFAMRMAGVFTSTTTTIGQKLGIFPRWLSWLGQIVAAFLLLLSSFVPWSELVFPVWILGVSLYILVTTIRPQQAQASPPARGDTAPSKDVQR